MGINVYSGLPGSGKTISAVEHAILPALRSGRSVVTNVALNMDRLNREGLGYLVTLIDLEELNDNPEAIKKWPKASVYVLDEVYSVWPAGLAVNRVPESHRFFFAKHRHNGENGISAEIFLITQDVQQIAEFIKVLVNRTIVTRKRTELGDKGENFYKVYFYSGCVSARRPGSDKPDSTATQEYNKAVFDYYQTHTGGDGFLKEFRIDKRGSSVFNSRAVRFTIPAAVLFLFFSIWLTVQAFDSVVPEKNEDEVLPVEHLPESGEVVTHSIDEKGRKVTTIFNPETGMQKEVITLPNGGKMTRHRIVKPRDDEPAPPPEQPKPKPEPKPEPASSAPKISQVWRIAATIQGQDGGIVFLQSVSGQARRVSANDCSLAGVDPSCLVDGARVTLWSGDGGAGAISGLLGQVVD